MSKAAPKTAPVLASLLGHVFADSRLLTAALTHPSLSPRRRTSDEVRPASDYERLEFLGDRVLALVVAEWLYRLHPDAREGDLARRHAALVNRETLARVAARTGLAAHIQQSKGKSGATAELQTNIQADALEAVIGALYLDGGLAVARPFIESALQPEIVPAKPPPQDPKSALQEWAQSQGLPIPTYAVVQQSGPAHATRFEIRAELPGFAPVTASGASKRTAEKNAASQLLQQVTKKQADTP